MILITRYNNFTTCFVIKNCIENYDKNEEGDYENKKYNKKRYENDASRKKGGDILIFIFKRALLLLI